MLQPYRLLPSLLSQWLDRSGQGFANPRRLGLYGVDLGVGGCVGVGGWHACDYE
jgi:hypothetical protein